MRVCLVCLLLCLVFGASSSLSSSGSRILKRSIPDDDDESTESEESDELNDSDETAENEPEEVGQAATIEEQVSSLRNETQTKKQTLTRLEAFFEQLERRILRLEAANNGTRGVTESSQESITSPAPETTTNLSCCQKIKLKSRKYTDADHTFLGVYTKKHFGYIKFSNEREIISDSCNHNEWVGYYSQEDQSECRNPKYKFTSGFTEPCITGPNTYTVLHLNNEGMAYYNDYEDSDDPDYWWEEDDTLTIVCVDDD